MSQQPPDINTKTLAETNNFIAWSAEEPARSSGDNLSKAREPHATEA